MTRIFVSLVFSFSALASASTPPYSNTPTLRFAQVEGGVYRGAAPASLDEVKALKALGIKTIINLEEEKKKIENEADEARAADLQYVSVPLSGFFAPSNEDADDILRMMNNPSLQPIYIHCAHGRERTGVMVALYRFFYDHWTAKAAYAEMKAFGYRPLDFEFKTYLEYRTGAQL